jgi:hypothetical protein
MRYTPPWVDIWEVHVWEMYVWKVQLACECMRYMGNFDFRFWQSGTVTYLICRYRRAGGKGAENSSQGRRFLPRFHRHRDLYGLFCQSTQIILMATK